MAIARLCKVIVNCQRRELPDLLAKLMQFRFFHPSKRSGLVQDFEILLFASRSQSIYSKANELLSSEKLKIRQQRQENVVEELKSSNVETFLQLLEDDLATAQRSLYLFTEESDKAALRNFIRAIQEASLVIFRNLSRIMVLPPTSGLISIEGYIPAGSVNSFKQTFGNYVGSILSVSKRGEQDPYVPSLLVNSKTVSLFESLSQLQGVPKYNEVDPTPIIALVFPFFFGIMFGDVGHGVVLLALGLFLQLKTKYDYWGKLIVVFGIAATIVGFLRGVFFGVVFASPASQLIKLPEAFSAQFTLQYIPLLLEVAIIIGTFHLASAYAIGFVNQLRSNNYIEAFTTRLPTLTFYASLVALGLAIARPGLQLGNLFSSTDATPFFSELLGVYVPVYLTATISVIVALVSFAILAFGKPTAAYLSGRARRKVGKAFAQSFLEAITRPFEFFMNTVSYVRLGVLLISTTLLGSLIAGFLALGALGIALAVLCNLATLSLEGLILYIQDMRLHIYEWLSKFYIGSGVAFKPLETAGELFTINFIGSRFPSSLEASLTTSVL